MEMYRPALIGGIIFCVLSVALGALGAHALAPTLEQFNMSNAFETAVKYQFYHGLALLITGILSKSFKGKWMKRATILFILGILFFAGSIYAILIFKTTLGIGIGKFALITPLGGLCFVSGWCSLLFAIGSKQKMEK